MVNEPENHGRAPMRKMVSSLLAVVGLAIAAFVVACLVAPASTLAQNAYITNEASDTVSVINTATDTVIATIPVGDAPRGVAVSPDGRKVYITSVGSNTVSVIDTASNTVTATIPVGLDPVGVAVTPDGSKVYVANLGSNTVSVIDTASNTVTATIPGFVFPPIIGGVATSPFGLAVSPDGSKVYVTNFLSPFGGGVSVIDTASNTETAAIPVGGSSIPGNPPFGVAVTPDGSKVYVADADDPFHNVRFTPVSVIDTASNTVTASIPIGPVPVPQLGGSVPFGVAVSPDGRTVYVTSRALNTVSVIDTASNMVTATIPVGLDPVGVAVTSDGSKVYVANAGSSTVSVIATATNTVTATIPVGTEPQAFGLFIGPAPKFAGTPGKANCYGKSVSALARQYGGLNNAAAALGYSSARELQKAIFEFCEPDEAAEHTKREHHPSGRFD
jgi:YVTN family beta-propeller protein